MPPAGRRRDIDGEVRRIGKERIYAGRHTLIELGLRLPPGARRRRSAELPLALAVNLRSNVLTDARRPYVAFRNKRRPMFCLVQFFLQPDPLKKSLHTSGNYTPVLAVSPIHNFANPTPANPSHFFANPTPAIRSY
jgi:hypothetical protein